MPLSTVKMSGALSPTWQWCPSETIGLYWQCLLLAGQQRGKCTVLFVKRLLFLFVALMHKSNAFVAASSGLDALQTYLVLMQAERAMP